MVRHACFVCCKPQGNCPFCPRRAQLGRGQPVQRGGKWHARPARPELLESLASSKAHRVIRRSKQRCQSWRAGGAWAGPGIQKGRWAAGGKFEFAPQTCWQGASHPAGLGRAWAVQIGKSVFGPTGPSLCWLLEQNSALKMMRRLPVRCARCRCLEVARGARIAPSGGQDGRWSKIWT